MQIETDKVTIDVRYTESEAGTLTEYLCKEDDTVAVGQEVVRVDKGQHTHSTALICTLYALWIPVLGRTPHQYSSALHGSCLLMLRPAPPHRMMLGANAITAVMP